MPPPPPPRRAQVTPPPPPPPFPAQPPEPAPEGAGQYSCIVVTIKFFRSTLFHFGFPQIISKAHGAVVSDQALCPAGIDQCGGFLCVSLSVQKT